MPEFTTKIWLAEILIVLVAGGMLGWLCRQLRFPNAIAQVILGVILGTAVLGWITHSETLHTLGETGVVLMLGVAGVELGINRLRAAGWSGMAVAFLGIVLSIGGGYTVGRVYGSTMPEAMYLGLALGATSIGITVQVLQQFNLINHRVGEILVAAAVIDDVIALYLLGAVHGLLSDKFDATDALGFVVLAIAVLGALFSVLRLITQWLSRRACLETRPIRLGWILIAITFSAWLTHTLGLSSVVGAFFAGVGVGEGLTENMRRRVVHAFEPLLYMIVPFFFVMIGAQAEWRVLNQSSLLWLLLVLMAVAMLSKSLGGAFGAIHVESWRERWLIGFGMAARGEVSLVIAGLGFKQGHLTQPVFVALMLCTITTAILGPLFMLPMVRNLSTTQLPKVVR